MINKKIFASRLKECRNEMNLSAKELSEKIGVSQANISRYENAEHGSGWDVTSKLSEVFGVNAAWLMGADVPKYDNDLPNCKKVPILGKIAAGQPIYAEEYTQGFELVPYRENVDFCLIVKGDSMINVRIYDGDLVYIRHQSDVDNGQIAAVIIDGEEATLKRVYKYPGIIVLKAENPKYEDMVFDKKSAKDIKIIGKCVAVKINLEG